MKTKYGMKPEQNVIKFAVNNLAKSKKLSPVNAWTHRKCIVSGNIYNL
jgi:hypothetical protein